MKAVLGSAAAVMAFAAAVIFVPKVSAETGVARLSGSGTTSIPVYRKVTNVFGESPVTVSYELVEKEGNPAPIDGKNIITKVKMNTPDENNELNGNCHIQLQNLRFSKVGNYALTIREKAVSDPVNFMRDTENMYDILFQVTNVLDSNGVPTGELKVELMDQLYSYKEDAKVPLSATFEASAIRTHIAIANAVKGAGADTGKYFKYKVTMQDVGKDAEIVIAGQDSSVNYNGETIETSSSYKSTGEEDSYYIYLKHGQTATIGLKMDGDKEIEQLPAVTSYRVEKIDTDDGYETTVDGLAEFALSKTTTTADNENHEQTNNTVFTNSKDATVNTGAFVEAWPYLIVAAIGLSGFIIFRRLTRIA